MKKFLDCDWLGEMQFLCNTVQKKTGNWVQNKGNLVRKRVTNVTFWLANEQKNLLGAESNAPSKWRKIWIRSGPVSSKNMQWLAFAAHLLLRPKQL